MKKNEKIKPSNNAEKPDVDGAIYCHVLLLSMRDFLFSSIMSLCYVSPQWKWVKITYISLI